MARVKIDNRRKQLIPQYEPVRPTTSSAFDALGANLPPPQPTMRPLPMPTAFNPPAPGGVAQFQQPPMPSPYGGGSLMEQYGQARSVSPGSVMPAPAPAQQSPIETSAHQRLRDILGATTANKEKRIGAVAKENQYSAAGQGYSRDKDGKVVYKGQQLQSRERTPIRAHSPDVAMDPRTDRQFSDQMAERYQQRANESQQDREDRLFMEGQGIAANAGVGTAEAQAGRERDAAGTGLTLKHDIQRLDDGLKFARPAAEATFNRNEPALPMPNQPGAGQQQSPSAAALGSAVGAPEVGAYNGEQIDPEVARMGDKAKAEDINRRAQSKQAPAAQAGYQAKSEKSRGILTDAGEYASDGKIVNAAREMDDPNIPMKDKIAINKRAQDRIAELRDYDQKRKDMQVESNRKYEAGRADSKLKQDNAKAELAAKAKLGDKAGIVSAATTIVEQADLDVKFIEKYITRLEKMAAETKAKVTTDAKGQLVESGTEPTGMAVGAQQSLDIAWKNMADAQKIQRLARKQLSDIQRGIPVDLDEGKTATGPNGEQIIKRGGKWEPIN